jgi:hypothetical protein
MSKDWAGKFSKPQDFPIARPASATWVFTKADALLYSECSHWVHPGRPVCTGK